VSDDNRQFIAPAMGAAAAAAEQAEQEAEAREGVS
jgi:hypothetical protein